MIGKAMKRREKMTQEEMTSLEALKKAKTQEDITKAIEMLPSPPHISIELLEPLERMEAEHLSRIKEKMARRKIL